MFGFIDQTVSDTNTQLRCWSTKAVIDKQIAWLYFSKYLQTPSQKKTGGEHDLAHKLQFAISYSVPGSLVANPALLALWMNVLSQSIREGL